MTPLLKNRYRSKNVYSTMLDDIRSSISAGELGDGDRLPSERELADAYDISINSVRRGIDELRQEGVVKSRRGSGMFVSMPQENQRHQRCLDTLAVLFDTSIQGYHPYFSELRKGVSECLIQNGWRLWAPEETVARNKPDKRIVYHNIKQRLSMFLERGEFAGAIMSPAHATRLVDQLDYDLPIVLPTHSDRFPFVAYNWDDELVAATRSVLRKGATRILFVVSGGRDDLGEVVDCAVMAEKADASPTFSWLNLPGMKNYFMVSKEAFMAMDAFLADANSSFDAVVVDSDFAAQGVMDALLAHFSELAQPAIISLIKNKLFKLNTPFSYTASVIDGYTQGIRMGTLLHETIASPETAPHNIWLHGEIVE